MKAIAVFVLLLFSTAAGFADTYSDFRSIVDFHATLKSLLTQPETLKTKKIYLLEGTIASINVLEPEPSRFYAEAEFFSAEWENKEVLKSYKIWLIFGKKDFSDRIPQRQVNNPDQNQIVANTRGLIVAEYLETVELEDGTKAPVFVVHEYRNLK